MDATTMGQTTWLIKQLPSDSFSTPSGDRILFAPSDEFRWDPSSHTVYYNESAPDAPSLLLHELGHALLGHTDYMRDIELLRLERAAWDKAIELATGYGHPIDDDSIEDHLDTYRNWLHARSLCPTCQATGLQSNRTHYTCISCRQTWRVNEARTCELRRYQTK